MIIKSLLDTDLYKFTTSYAYMKLFPDAVGIFSFKDRDDTIYTEEFIENLKIEFAAMGRISLKQSELEYITNYCRFIPSHYWEWLSSFRFDFHKIRCQLDDKGHLNIEVEDKLYKATLYEVPILAIISELRNRSNRIITEDVINTLIPKIQLSNQNQIKFSEFGTRRRFSYYIQEEIIKYIAEHSIYCTGTSNCFFAMKYNLKMMGTHPHEWFMFHGAQYGYKQANYMALENWVNVYDGDLGIALSDTYTSDIFIQNFSKKQAKLFDGVRCDSGDEFIFTNKVIERYKELGIDPNSKTIIFSNALTFDKCKDLSEYCKNRIKCSFGIGTNLTNDTGYKPANIVMKLTSCQMNKNQPSISCIKLSDDKGKYTGNQKSIEICLKTLSEYE